MSESSEPTLPKDSQQLAEIKQKILGLSPEDQLEVLNKLLDMLHEDEGK